MRDEVDSSASDNFISAISGDAIGTDEHVYALLYLAVDLPRRIVQELADMRTKSRGNTVYNSKVQ